jgi:hypothetical protein
VEEGTYFKLKCGEKYSLRRRKVLDIGFISGEKYENEEKSTDL